MEGRYEGHHDDLQIDTVLFAPFQRHTFACFPSFSTNLSFNKLVFGYGLVGEVGMK